GRAGSGGASRLAALPRILASAEALRRPHRRGGALAGVVEGTRSASSVETPVPVGTAPLLRGAALGDRRRTARGRRAKARPSRAVPPDAPVAAADHGRLRRASGARGRCLADGRRGERRARPMAGVVRKVG